MPATPIAAGARRQPGSQRWITGRSTEPTPQPEQNGTAIMHPNTVENRAQRVEELVSWTRREWLRFLWYRLRLTVSEMNYATRRMHSHYGIAVRASTHTELDNLSDLS
jgi:hypothetical protein